MSVTANIVSIHEHEKVSMDLAGGDATTDCVHIFLWV